MFHQCVITAQSDLDISFLLYLLPYLVMLPLQATEKLQPPSTDRIAESQPPPALPQLSKSPGKSFLPAVPSASKMKPSLSFHAGMRSKKENSKLGLFCISAPPLKRLEGVTVWAVISCLLLGVSEFQVFL